MNIKKMSLLLAMLLFQVNQIDSSGEENEINRLSQDRKRKVDESESTDEKSDISIRDQVIDLLSAIDVLQHGFNLVGLNYDDFLETQRSVIPEDDFLETFALSPQYSLQKVLMITRNSNNPISKIVMKAENKIIEHMNKLLKKGFDFAIKNHTHVDELTMKIFNYAKSCKTFTKWAMFRGYSVFYRTYIGQIIFDNIKKMKNSHSELLLHRAIQGNNLVVVNLLISIGVNVNIRSTNGSTTLNLAVTHGYVDIVRTLIAAGVDLDASDTRDNHDTPLTIAVRRGYGNIVQILLNAGANINKSADSQWTPLMYAINCNNFVGCHTLTIIQMLIREQADLNIKNSDGNTALMIAAQSEFGVVADLLINAGAHVDVVNNKGDTALMIAVQYGCQTITTALIRAGANIDLVNNQGLNAINMADVEMKQVINQTIIMCEAAGLDELETTDIAEPQVTATGESNIITTAESKAVDYDKFDIDFDNLGTDLDDFGTSH